MQLPLEPLGLGWPFGGREPALILCQSKPVTGLELIRRRGMTLGKAALQLRAASREELMGAAYSQYSEQLGNKCLGPEEETWAGHHCSIFNSVPLRTGFSFSATKEMINIELQNRYAVYGLHACCEYRLVSSEVSR